MKIGLYDVDSHNGFPNLALMKLSAYHKQRGDHVEFYSPLFRDTYDRIYASQIFTFTQDPYLQKDKMIIGGSGVNLDLKLPYCIEHIYPDYELYGIDFAEGFRIRGCIRNEKTCPFCIVPRKEGNIRFNAHLEEFCKDQEKVMFLDNNFLAYKDHLHLLEILPREKRYQWNQGLDIRLINDQNAELLSKLKTWKGLDRRFAFDDPRLEDIIIEKVKILKHYGIKRSRFYVLIGYNTTWQEDLFRVQLLESLKQRIFVMPYNKFDPYQRAFARWVNRFRYLKVPFTLEKEVE